MFIFYITFNLLQYKHTWPSTVLINIQNITYISMRPIQKVLSLTAFFSFFCLLPANVKEFELTLLYSTLKGLFDPLWSKGKVDGMTNEGLMTQQDVPVTVTVTLLLHYWPVAIRALLLLITAEQQILAMTFAPYM